MHETRWVFTVVDSDLINDAYKPQHSRVERRPHLIGSQLRPPKPTQLCGLSHKYPSGQQRQSRPGDFSQAPRWSQQAERSCPPPGFPGRCLARQRPQFSLPEKTEPFLLQHRDRMRQPPPSFHFQHPAREFPWAGLAVTPETNELWGPWRRLPPCSVSQSRPGGVSWGP